MDSDSNAVSVFLYGKHTSLLENGTIKGGGDGVSSEAKPSPDAAAVGFSFFLTMRQSCTWGQKPPIKTQRSQVP